MLFSPSTVCASGAVRSSVQTASLAKAALIFVTAVGSSLANASNSPPVFTTTPITTAQANVQYVLMYHATDPNKGDKLTWTAAHLPSWLHFNATGRLYGTPSPAQVGTYKGIVVGVTDGKRWSGKTFDITVKKASTSTIERPPVISGSPATTGAVGASYTFTPAASDPNGDHLTFSIANKPTWANFSSTTGALTGTPTQAATFSNIGITVSDGTQTASLAAFSIAVKASVSGVPPVTTPDPPVTTPPSGTPVANNCGMQLGTKFVFCDTFDAPAGIGNRSGDLNGNLWGVSRALGSGVNFGQQQYGMWNPTVIQKCDGTSAKVIAPHDILICNGQLREAVNDNNSGAFDAGDVTSLAMYPKQPFDFAGRTGTVSFDISNDTAGSHAAWPEFWLSDLPVPDPFNHFDSWQSNPANGLGIRFHAQSPIGQYGICPNANNLDKVRWTVGSAAVVRNYVLDDTDGYGKRSAMTVKTLDCVIEPSGPGQMNHVELRISQNQVDIYATDAGVAASPATLKHIAVISNANLTLTRGLIWLEDVHYNADKGDPARTSQRQHTFAWDNVAFDGPFTYRDYSYDAPDSGTPAVNGAINLGKMSQPNQTSSWTVSGVPAASKASAARVLFNLQSDPSANPSTLNVIVNGHAHSVAWPFPDQIKGWRTYAVTVPITDLIQGTNTVQLGANTAMVYANVNLVLVDVAGGVPAIPGNSVAFPN
jgi:hypothetical protein